jgi:glycerophosphoryl diester phosphodiesterase
MRIILSISLLCLITTCPIIAHAQLIVAHRGASHDAPENTLAAFELAWEKQADAIEADFYVTKDRQIVCIHDDTTKRVSPQHPELIVAETTANELQKIDVGSWKHPRFAAQRIPTLEQVIATVPDGKQIFVEIKCGPEILPILKLKLTASDLKSEQIVIICFNKDVVSQCRKMMPQYKANWLTSYKQGEVTGKWKPTRADVLNTLDRTAATGLGTNGNLEVIDEPFVGAVKAAGLEFHVWTINDADQARVFKSLGVRSVTTDRPAFIRNAIGATASTKSVDEND